MIGGASPPPIPAACPWPIRDDALRAQSALPANDARRAFKSGDEVADQAMLNLVIGLAEFDEQSLDQAQKYFEAVQFPGGDLNAIIARRRLALIRTDRTLLSRTRADAEKAYSRYAGAVDARAGYSREMLNSLAASTHITLAGLVNEEANAIGGAKGRTLLDRAAKMARSGAEQATDSQWGTRRSDFLILAITIELQQAHLDDDRLAARERLDELRALWLSQTDPLRKRDMGRSFAAALIADSTLAQPSARRAALDEALLIARQAEADLLNGAKNLDREAQFARLNGGLSGTWEVAPNESRDLCALVWRVRALQARAEMLIATDETEIAEARRRFRAADGALIAMPAYRRDLSAPIALADSFQDAARKAPPGERAALRDQARVALDDADRLASACFCAFDRESIQQRRAGLDE